MLGYWATGKLRNETIPAIVMIIEITIATIGRLMKNFAITPPGFLARRRFLRLWWLPRISRTCLRLLIRFRSHNHARPNLLDSLDNDLFPFFQSFGDNHLALKARPDLNRPNFGFVIRTNDSDLITSLKLHQRALGHEQSPSNLVDCGPRFCELSWP